MTQTVALSFYPSPGRSIDIGIYYPAMNDLLDDPHGDFFIDDNHYADIALHMVKYMYAHLEYVPPAGYPDLIINFAFQTISLLYLSNTLHSLSKNPG